MAPVGPQLGLAAEQARAPDDQSPARVGGLGDLCLAVLGVVDDRLPRGLGDLVDDLLDLLDHSHADRVLPARLLEPSKHFGRPEPGVRPQQLDPGRAGAIDARDQLIAEAQHPFLRVRRSPPEPDVQHLSGVSSGSEDRVIPQHLRVPVGGTLLEPAAHLTDEAVDINHQPAIARAGARAPRTRERVTEQLVELTDMPECERPQERSERRRGRDPPTQQPASPAGPEHVAVIDAVSAEQHREHERHHLATRVRRPRPIRAQPDQTTSALLDPEPLSQGRDEHNPSVRNHSLVIENNVQAVQSDRLVIMHHEGDLLIAGRDRRHRSLLTCSGGHSSFRAGQNHPTAAVDQG